MSDFWLGILALLVGLLFCFRGQVALRVVISVWGGFVGFHLAAALVAAATAQPPFSGWPGWVAAIIGALLFAALAHTFYSLAVIIGTGSVGFGLGSVLATWLGAGEGVAVVVGLVVAIALAVVALLSGLPDLLLILLSALGGAAAIVSGALLLASAAGFEPGLEPWLAGAIWLAVTIAGIIVQSRLERATNLRGQWGRGGRSR